MMYLDFFKALVYTAVFSLLITPFDFPLASAIGAIDIPKDARRMHTKPIPRLGGISIFASFAVFSLFFCQSTPAYLIGALLGAVALVILGIIDDCTTLSAKIKLTVQAVAAITAVSFLNIEKGVGINLLVFGILWLVLQTNAHNFIDGLDGLCAGISLIEATALGIVFILASNYFGAFFVLVAGGACIGFLPYNDKSAKIFMGDTGSSFLGFILGFASLILLFDLSSLKAFISICFVLFIPLFDILFAIIRRFIKGCSIFKPDRSHIHHILSDSTLGHRGASVLIRIISLIFAIIGVLVFSI